MIDWARVAELRNEIGDEDFTDVVEIFLEEVEGEIRSLKSDCTPTDLESRFHSLKGSASSLGFKRFSELCQIGEAAAAMGEESEIDINSAVEVFNRSKSEFLAGLGVL
ncbi:Hpt domain-containing protein [Roseovarius dicentrarchi]|uniref:Hpt domain-containing protein n=1 Tax=Roseovarius dicentrarchi TaxID=2250573 RepID=UPI000DEA3C36|nr:Hpt domain-containing protein [Roseovarius dicentrarchi]